MQRTYIGTYTRDGSQGIYLTEIDPAAGTLTPPQLAAATKSPSFLARHPTLPILYAVNDDQAKSGVSAFHIQSGGTLAPINDQPVEKGPSCYISVTPDGRTLLVANYGSGTVGAFPLAEDGRIGEQSYFNQHEGSGPNAKRQEKAHAHCFVPDPTGQYALSCDLGCDKIFIYKITGPGQLTPVEPASVSPGDGPRHIAFGKDGTFAYVVSEMTGTVTVFAWDADKGTLRSVQEVEGVSQRTDDLHGAEVRLHPSGRFLYTSNRGPNTISLFQIDASTGKLTRTSETPCGGNWPRNFNVDPSGRFLVVSNERSGDVTLFRVEPSTGALSKTDSVIRVGAPVCVLFEPAR